MTTNNREGNYEPPTYTPNDQRGELYAHIIMSRLPEEDEQFVIPVYEDTEWVDSESMHIIEHPVELTDRL